MKHSLLLFVLVYMFCGSVAAQDTYSIVGVDSATGEVGSAGASCVDLTNFSLDADFLGELFPGVGAVNTQAWYLPGNQANARNRMNAGDTPQEIIDYVITNDIEGDSTKRQYGVAAIIDGMPQAAAHTGSSTDDWKGHRVGDNYSVQGNILLGDFIVNAMESNFVNTPGSLPVKLMAALQGANVVGADTRCADNGTSALFAFLKVAQPDDIFGSPSLVLGVITEDGDGIEPVDSLQSLFNEWMGTNTSTEDLDVPKLSVYPNPAGNLLHVEVPFTGLAELAIYDIAGNLIEQRTALPSQSITLDQYTAGVYILRVQDERGRVLLARFIKE